MTLSYAAVLREAGRRGWRHARFLGEGRILKEAARRIQQGNVAAGEKGAHLCFMDLQRRLEAAGPFGSDGKGGILPPLFVKMRSGSMKRGRAPEKARTEPVRGSKRLNGNAFNGLNRWLKDRTLCGTNS